MHTYLTAANLFDCSPIRRQYSVPSEQPASFLGHLTSLVSWSPRAISVCCELSVSCPQVSNMLVPSESLRSDVKINEAVLMALYEAVHLNRNFITILTHVSV